jgi:hypothetical protein
MVTRAFRPGLGQIHPEPKLGKADLNYREIPITRKALPDHHQFQNETDTFGKYGYDSLTHAKSILISPPDASIDHLYPPFTMDKIQALNQWLDY